MKMLQRILARRDYRRRGYQVFRRALPVDLIDALTDAIRRHVLSHTGPLLRQDSQCVPHDFFPGTSLVRNPLANAHLPLCKDLRPLESALAAVVTAPVLADRLRVLDGADHYHINQTLLFFAAQTTNLHIDSWALDTVPHGAAHTLWIPLQDMEHRSGMPAVVPWPVGQLVSERELGLAADAPHAERYERYHQALSARIMSEAPEIATALVRRGDVLVWSSLTPHLTLPSHPFPVERLSIQVLLRPAGMRWGNFTVQPADYPMTRIIKATEQFSFFVPEEIHRDFGIGESYRPLPRQTLAWSRRQR